MVTGNSQNVLASANHAWPTFYGEIAGLVEKGGAVHAISLDFRKVFNTIFHTTPVFKLGHRSLDGGQLYW